MDFKWMAAACAAMIVGGAGSAAADTTNMIVNGGFDVGTEGWSAVNIDDSGGWRTTGGDPGGMFILNDGGSELSDPTIEQTVMQLLPASVYRVTGRFRGANQVNSPLGGTSFAADLDGATVFTGGSLNTSMWQGFEFEFTATATSVDLRFRAEINGTDNDFAIDNITLTRVSTPCFGDITGNGVVDGVDLAALLAAWGGGKSQFDCDIDNDGVVGGGDLAFVLAGWGACP
jgi:hypothetical protein